MMDKKMCAVHKASWLLVLVGALNWGLVGLFEFDLVAWLLGGGSLLTRIVYVLVGVAALALLGKHKCKMCIGGGEKKKEGMEKKPESSMGGEGGGMPQ